MKQSLMKAGFALSVLLSSLNAFAQSETNTPNMGTTCH